MATNNNNNNNNNSTNNNTLECNDSIDEIKASFWNKSAKDDSRQEIVLSLDDESKIATLCIKSAAKNAISPRMMCMFSECLDKLEQWTEGKAVLLYGHNDFFCSGADLQSVRKMVNSKADGAKMAKIMHDNTRRMAALPMISISLIVGRAVGGGAEVSMCTDLRLMAETASIGFVHAHVGICTAWGGASRLVNLVGASRALEMMASGRYVNAEEAIKLGLASYIIPASSSSGSSSESTDNQTDYYLNSAINYIKTNLLFGTRKIITSIKTNVYNAKNLPLREALELEQQIFVSSWGSDTQIEALNRSKH